MDRYQRIKKIGEGAFGKAVLVRNKQTNRQCVVKEINIVKMGSREREEARKEVAVLSQLKHPNIITYIDSFEESGTLYIVMNYCAGGDLYARISSQQGRLFSEDQILTWFVQICLALKHIHDRKILHRDIKSQNVFLTSGGAVQLGDFGIAKVLSNTVELARTCIGTPYYLSPEIVENKPYNNKSDIWSLGCVLYELTTLKHAFEAGNMKNLVLKIIRGSYPPIPPTYSYDLRGLIAQMFKRAPRDRPSINSILRKNFVMERVRKVTSEEVIAAEFSHTVLHGAKIQKQLPPAAKAVPSPRPSSAPKRSVTPRPNSAGRGRYNPANVYAAPLVGRKSQNNRSSDDKKKGGGNVGGSGGARPLPVPGQMEWQQKKKDLQERELRRRDEDKKKWEEQLGRRHQNLVEKQKMDRINKAREDGWKHLANLPDNLNQQSPRRNGEARPLPVPNLKPEVGNMPNFDNHLRERGNYDNYMAYLDQLKANRLAQEKQMKAAANYTPAPKPLIVDPKAPAPVQAALVINQANYDRQMGADAAERAKLVEEYQQRRQAAARNKARGLADLYGRPPSGHRTPTPVQRPAPVRNKVEQEYLEKLRQIREQNMREHRDILRQKAGIPPEDKDPESARIRKEKADALKQQAEDWAKKKKDLQDPQHDKAPNGRPDHARNLTPAPPVPVSGVLHLIGAGDKAGLHTPGSKEPEPANDDSTKGVQQKKIGILKRLNEKSAAQGKERGQWGSDKPASPAMAVDDVQLRRPWAGKCATPVAQDPEAARQQWSDEQLRLSVLPLEHTSSDMEVTSDADKVERFHPLPGQTSKAEETPKLVRNQWGRPGSSLVRALNQLPVIEGTVILDTDVSGGSVEATKATAAPKPAVSYTISLQTPSPSPTPPLAPSTPATPRPLPTPSVHPPVRSGTIVLKPADTPTTTSGAAPPPVSPELFGVMAGKVLENESGAPSESSLATAVSLEPLIGETELPASKCLLQGNNPQQANIFKHLNLVTVDESANERTEKSDEREDSQDDSGIEASVCSPERADEQSTEQDQKTSETGNGTSVSPKTETQIPQADKARPDGVPNLDLKSKSKIAVTPTVWLNEEKAVQPAAASGQDPSRLGDGDVSKSGDSVAASDDSDDSEGLAVRKGLCTGNFDMQDVKMLRTCSEPDMTKFFRELDSRMTRHGSMELKKELDDNSSVKNEASIVNDDSQGIEGDTSCQEVPMEEVPMEDEVPVEEEEDEDLISLRATMQSLLCEDDVPVDDGSSDDEDDELKCLQDTMIDILSDESGAVKFNATEDPENTLKNGGAGDGPEQVEENKGEKSEENKGENKIAEDLVEEDHSLATPEKLKLRCQSDSALALHHMQLLEKDGKAAEEDSKMMEEEEEESEEEEVRYCTADILALGDGHDSDEETIFGDEDNDDLDLFSRLEQQRTDLENELGMDMFVEVYKTVQALQEDEDEKMEEGMNIALQLLGKEKEHLYHKIFNLVLADTAFTEDNT